MQPLIDYDLALSVYLNTLLDEKPAPALHGLNHNKAEPSRSTLAGHEYNECPSVSLQSLPPAWAENPFPCIAFKCGKKTLSVPLNRLQGAQRLISSSCYRPPDNPAWLYGFIELDGAFIKLLDVGKLLKPVSTQLSEASEADHPFDYLIRVANAEWAFVCHDLPATSIVSKVDVCWRRAETNPQWLLGSIPKFSSILLDLEALLVWLNNNQTYVRIM